MSKSAAAVFNTKVDNLIKDIEAIIANKNKSGDDAAKEIEKALNKYTDLADQWESSGTKFAQDLVEQEEFIDERSTSASNFAKTVLDAHKDAQSKKDQAEQSSVTEEELKALLDEVKQISGVVNTATTNAKGQASKAEERL